MKKLIAFTTLLVATSTFAQSTNSKTKIKTKDKTFTERIGFWYYGELDRNRISNDKNVTGDKKLDFLNYLNTSYELDSKSRINLTLRMNVTDRQAPNGAGDRYEELDPRLGVDRLLMDNGTSSLRVRAVFELPMSRYSNYTQGDRRITRFKPSATFSTKIDDYNRLMVFAGFNKTYYHEASASVEGTSRHYVTSWISYSNSALSEKYQLRIDAETLMRHQGGTQDLNMKASSGEERILAGVSMNIPGGVNLFPYLQHDPSLVKAANMLGGGVQIFKAF